MADDLEPGRPALAAVFAAWVVTTVAGVACVQLLARWLPPAPPPGTSPPAAALTLCVGGVLLAFACAQAALPGPKSSGCLGLGLPIAGAAALALRGVGPAAVIAALFTGVFLTPVGYYLAIRWSRPLAGFPRRRPLPAVALAAGGAWFVVEAARWLTWLADPATHGRFW